MKFVAQIVLIFLSLAGCTHLASLSTTSIPKERGRVVEAVSDRFIFLGFNFNNDYVNDMIEDLANQCPHGKIKGVLTKHENITYFPLVAHKVRVSAKGYCLETSNGKN